MPKKSSTTIVEALAILEAATLRCKTKNVDSPKVREALDLLQPHTQPDWLIPQFRWYLESDGRKAHKQAQSDVLRATFPGIRNAVQTLLKARKEVLAREFDDSRDENLKHEMNYLAAEIVNLEKPWLASFE